MHMKQQLSQQQCPPAPIYFPFHRVLLQSTSDLHSQTYGRPVSACGCGSVYVCVSSLSHSQHAALCNTRRHMPLSLPPNLWSECEYQPSGMSSYPDWGQSLEQVKTRWTAVQEVAEHQRNNTSRIWLCLFCLFITLVSYCLAECTWKYKCWSLFAKHEKKAVFF